MERSRRGRPRLAVVVVAGWLIGTAYAFWWYGLKDLRPFESARTVATFDALARANSAEAWFRTAFAGAPAVPTVVHLYVRDCSCNRAARAHLERIEADYAARGVRFAAVAVDAPVRGVAPPGWLDSVPAALVFDAHGRLAYYGPYGDSADCTRGGTRRLVEGSLDALLAGRPPAPRPELGVGCWCSARHDA
jgi:hypothetical protein